MQEGEGGLSEASARISSLNEEETGKFIELMGLYSNVEQEKLDETLAASSETVRGLFNDFTVDRDGQPRDRETVLRNYVGAMGERVIDTTLHLERWIRRIDKKK